jgi:hypothetical protein
VDEGLTKLLLPATDPHNERAGGRQMGVTLSRYVGETFTATTPTQKITNWLVKEQRRWGGESPHFRYTFAEVTREPAPEDASGGPRGGAMSDGYLSQTELGRACGASSHQVGRWLVGLGLRTADKSPAARLSRAATSPNGTARNRGRTSGSGTA